VISNLVILYNVTQEKNRKQMQSLAWSS